MKQIKTPAFMELMVLLKPNRHRDTVSRLLFKHKTVKLQYTLTVTVLRSQQGADL